MPPTSPDEPAAPTGTRRSVLRVLVVVATLGLLFELWQWNNRGSAVRGWNVIGISALWGSILASNVGLLLVNRGAQRTLSLLSIALAVTAIAILLTRAS